jgi:hypothetical protein
MNTNVAKNTSASGGGMKIVVGIIGVIALLVGLYYLYEFLYKGGGAQTSVVLLPGNVSFTGVKTEDGGRKFAQKTSIQGGILDGGEYSVSFWVYITDTKGVSSGSLGHIMEISYKRFENDSTKRGKTLLFVGINPMDGSLIVRQNSTDAAKYTIDNYTATGANNNYKLDQLIKGYMGASTYKTDDRCDIINGIEYQRWVLINTVSNGRTLDVYVDGKLARSCVYTAPWGLASKDGSADCYFSLNNGSDGKGIKGYLSAGNYYNYALTPSAIWSIYQQGPGGSFDYKSFFSNLFSTSISFGTTAGTS